MKKFISVSSVLVIALSVFVFAAPVQATVTPTWDVTGTYTWLVLGTYSHDLVITTQNPDGTFSGTGGYPAGASTYATTETIVGQVVGSAVTFTTTYAGPYNPGYSVTVSGTIAADGTMSGTSPWEWHTTSGAANVTNVPDWGQQLSASRCLDKVGSPVVNITQKVINDVDSGVAGNWAIDSYNRHIKVWRTGSKTSDTYCALVTYEGTAEAVAGQTGPGGTGVIGSDVSAQMKGGYRATFSGTFEPTGEWKTKGSVGTTDYGCDITGGTCTYVSWLDKYFTGVTGFSQPWWGWFYYGGTHGSWLNSVDGNLGNIL